MKMNMISIGMCAFALMACGASKETVINQEKADWGQLSFRETLQTQVVPMSEANLAIPITTLQDLPPAAVFHQSSCPVGTRHLVCRIPLRQSDAIGVSV